jgi:lipoprotein-releasing system permease protein
VRQIVPSGIFSIQQEFDSKYVFVPISFMEDLLDKKDMLSYAEIRLKPGSDLIAVQERVSQACGSRFTVLNRHQQDVVLYKILKSEKWAIFLILTFILLIATFNVVGSLTMLILEKRKDMAVLWSMGAGTSLLRNVFLAEGLMIGIGGALAGLLAGGLLAYLQQRFGLISLGNQGAFLVDAYPVKIKVLDFITVFLTVSSITLLATWFSVRRISARLLEKRTLS